MFDTHAHLFDEKILPQIDVVLEKLAKENCKGVICICETELEIDKFLQYYQNYKFLYCSLGVHPHNANQFDKTKFEQMYHKLEHTKRLVAIGETGLDFYYNFSDKETQKEVFIYQIEFAKNYNLPLIIHSRNSNELVFKILQFMNWYKGVIHCFSGDVNEAKKFVDLGFKLGVTGIITFKNAKKLKDVVTSIPLETLVVETDSPYLSPEPVRGKVNTPLNLKYIISEIASLRNFEITQLENFMDRNAIELFNII